MEEVHSDCRTEEGITIGLIDSLIFICRELARKDLSSEMVQSTLRDFRNDADVKKLFNAPKTINFSSDK